MQIEVKVWLYDVLNAIVEIESYFEEHTTFEEFKSDLKTKKAIERNIEIIGEAMNRILKKDSEIQITQARQIVDVRNRIIHGYDTVSDEIIWAIVWQYIPVLQKEVSNLLEE